MMLICLFNLASCQRTFEIKGNDFVMDGKPFTIIGGEFHYFRQIPEYWEDTLKKMANAGINTVFTYVAWNMHEPRKGEYKWDGMSDIERFINLCNKLNMYVGLRVGPFICGEWENAGYPYWIQLKKYNVKGYRYMDPGFIEQVSDWFNVFYAKMKKHMYVNGGNIIIVQIENEYGWGGHGDKKYLAKLAELTRSNLGKETVLYTCDNPVDYVVKEGSNAEVALVAIDFSIGQHDFGFKKNFDLALKFNGGTGPNFNAEYHPGRLGMWGKHREHQDPVAVSEFVDKTLSYPASIDMYMFYGGTNFGFMTGANGNYDRYEPLITSYDFDAPLSEAGDMTYKYELVKKVIGKHYPQYIQNYTVSNTTKKAYGEVKLTQGKRLFDSVQYISDRTILSYEPTSFENVHHPFGFMLYSKNVEQGKLKINKVCDRASIYLNQTHLDTFQREKEREVAVGSGRLDILVENLGRINQGINFHDSKGIQQGVKLNNEELHNWEQTPLDFDRVREIIFEDELPLSGPSFYRGTFRVDEACDTFFNPSGLKHGFAFVNGHNLGRYWTCGPQLTLYCPGPFLEVGENELIIFETEDLSSLPTLSFDDTPQLDTIPE